MIALFDSGVGGLTVFKAISRLLPEQPLLYYADSAHLPYGTKSPDELEEYLYQASVFLAGQGATHLVIACHTLSTLRRRRPLPLRSIDLRDATLHALRSTRHSKVLLLGTSNTIRANTYVEMLNMLRPDLQIEAIACPTFVPLIESRQLEGPAIETAVAATLPVLSEPTTVLLGCTHYPLIGELLKTRLGPHAHLIDPAHELATRIAGLSHTAPSSGVRTIPTRPRHRFYTTGDLPRFASLIDLILKPRKEYAIELQKI